MNNDEWIDKKAKTLKISDKDFVVNLEWRNKQTKLGNAPRITRNLARENAPDDIVDVFFPYIGMDKMYAQLGYGVNNNLPSKAKSLAVALLSARDGKWAGVFKISKDTSYLIFINDDLIDPDGDIIGESKYIEEKFKNICELNDLKAEQYFSYIEDEESGIEALEKLLDDANLKKVPSYKTIDLNIKQISPIFYTIPVLIIAVFIGYGYMKYQDNIHQEKLKNEANQAKMRKFRQEENLRIQEENEEYRRLYNNLVEIKKEKFEEVYENAKKEKPKPWAEKSDPMDMFSFCSSELKKMPLFKSTWKLENASCNENNIIAVYQRDSIVNVDEFLSENPNARLDALGETATFIEDIKYEFNKAKDKIPENNIEYNRARYDLIGFLQNRNVTYNLGSSSIDITNIGGNGGNFNSTRSNIIERVRNTINLSSSNSNSENIVNETNNTQDNFKEKYENHMKEDDIRNITVEDLPMEYLERLNTFFEVDWATEQLNISSHTTLDWFNQIIPSITGLRVDEVRVDVSSSSQIEWRMIGTFYYKEEALLQGN